jgi:hypothetical protein
MRNSLDSAFAGIGGTGDRFAAVDASVAIRASRRRNFSNIWAMKRTLSTRRLRPPQGACNRKGEAFARRDSSDAILPFYSWRLMSYKMAHTPVAFNQQTYRQIFLHRFPALGGGAALVRTQVAAPSAADGQMRRAVGAPAHAAAGQTAAAPFRDAAARHWKSSTA